VRTLEDNKTKDYSKNLVSQRFKKSNIVVISENSLEVYLIKKYLPKEQGYRVIESNSLKDTLKIVNYLQVDLIIVDDKINDDSGIEVLKRLLSYAPLKDTPLMLLLSHSYEDTELPKFSHNVEYIKKPIDEAIFKHRVMLLVDKAQGEIQRSSYFNVLAFEKIEKAKEYLSIYHDIFLRDSHMKLIYDDKKKSFVEANDAFEKFFTNIRLFNRIFFNKKAIKKYLPRHEEANYLNYYDSKKWIDMVLSNDEFNYSIKIKKSYEEYSFNIIAHKLDVSEGDLYLIKLINVYDYIPSKLQIKSANLKLKEQNLSSFKEDFLALRSQILQNSSYDKTVEDIFSKMSSKLSIICDDPSIVKGMGDLSNDIYKSILNLLKQYKDKKITLNQKDLDDKSHQLEAGIYAKVDLNLMLELIRQIVSLQVIGSDLEVLVYQSSDMIIFEFALLGDIDKANQSIKDLCKKINASIEFIEEEDKSIVVVNIPK